MGRAWIALRDDELAAASSGVPIVRTKLLAYGVGAALGGVSGAFLASYLSTVNSDQFTFSFSIFILAMVVLGGLGSIWGVVVGAVLLSLVNSYLLPRVLYDVPGMVGLDFDLSQISSGIYGFLLVIVMLLRPQGLFPDRRSIAARDRKRRRPSPELDRARVARRRRWAARRSRLAMRSPSSSSTSRPRGARRAPTPGAGTAGASSRMRRATPGSP